MTCEWISKWVYSEKKCASHKLTCDKGFSSDSKTIFWTFSFGAPSMSLLTYKYVWKNTIKLTANESMCTKCYLGSLKT